jgi:competence protein ComEA
MHHITKYTHAIEEVTMKAKHLMIVSSALIALFLLVGSTVVPAANTSQTSREGKGSVVAAGDQKVNINTADVAALTTLKGVGPQLAERITAFRKNNGPFAKVEDLLQVKGVGEKIIERNKGVIAVK